MNRLGEFGKTAGILLCGILFTASLIPAPEGTVRSGDFLPFTAGWLLLLGIAAGVQFFRKIPILSKNSLNCRTILPVGCFLLFFGWMTFSYIELLRHKSGNSFFASYQYWNLAGAAFFYFLLRLFRKNTKKIQQVLLTGIFTVILAESFFAGYCYLVQDPAFREAYRANPEKVLAENGLNYPAGSPERILLENRLLNSTEPLGTYSLTNTLAGVLVPGIILLITLFFWNGYLYFIDRRQKKRLVAGVTAFILLIPAGIILILTKSRSGYLAVFSGSFFALAAAGICAWRLRQKETGSPSGVLNRFIKWGAVIIPILFIGTLAAAWSGGILDREVFSEAKKSLGYRIDYWRASSRILADKPLLGVGPGNFQPSYSQYMDAAASEVVADPHNFLFEAAALFGIPAGLFLIGFILTSAAESLRKQNSTPTAGETSYSGRFTAEVFIAVLAGIGLGYHVSLSGSAPVDFDFLLAAVPALAIALPAAGIFTTSPITPLLFLPAAMALLVNLLAAGGIFFPACLLPLIFFITQAAGPGEDQDGINTAQTAAADGEEHSKQLKTVKTAYFVLYILLLGVAFFYLHQTCRLHRMEKAALDQLEQSGTISHSVEMPLAGSTPVQRYFLQIRLYAYQQSPTPENWNQVLQVRDRLFSEAVTSAPIRFEAGKLFLQTYQQVRAPELLQEAIESFAESVERFPTNAEYRAYYGLALLRTGKPEAGQEELKKSLELDNLTPHKDRKLAEPLRKSVESKLAAQNTAPNN